ncbi:MAG: GNAT family N-acetyltransferase [Acidobacteria bacterium]|nr:GNAT family N-acetyltransferase [Acidobacteriota bacterium]
MPLPDTPLAFGEAERALGERLRKLAAETDQIEGYQQPHAERLARLAEAVGLRCGLYGTDLTALKFAALAHDLGERKLKREYLRRSSRLNWEEQLDLWRHPILSEQEAQTLKLSREVQLLVRWHHEWWNGTGYPDGLAGAAIPLGSRILRTVDTWCALTADRPYRGAFDAEVAEQKLIEQTGLECDPQVVKALRAVLAEERADAEMDYATTTPQSYETVPMEAITISTIGDTTPLTESEPLSNVIEMPSRFAARPVPEVAEEFLAPERATPESAGTEDLPEAPSSVTFDVPTLKPHDERPAPPTPPPVPLWQRLNQPEWNRNALLDDSPDAKSDAVSDTAQQQQEVAPVVLTPTEEVPIVDVAAFNEQRLRANTLGLGSFLPEPAPLRSTPLTVVPASKLQVVALSEVPDHFWLVAKWIYEEWWETPDNSISVVSNLLKEHLASTTVPQTFVALLDGQPVGSISLVEKDLSERADLITPWLNWLYVLPAHRRQGIGSRLLGGAFTRAKLQGAETIHAAVPAELAGFFIRHGWEIVEREIGVQRLSLMTRTS